MHGWRQNLNLTHDLIDRLGRCSSAAEIRSRFLDYVSSFGVSNTLAGVIPPLGLSTHAQRSHVVLEAWPEEWSNVYFAKVVCLSHRQKDVVQWASDGLTELVRRMLFGVKFPRPPPLRDAIAGIAH